MEVTSNPEAVIKAAVAAAAAAEAASQAFTISMVVLGLMILLFAVMIFIAFGFRELRHNTDGMKDALVEATRKLALIEGNLIGRAEQTAEQKEK